MLFSYFSLSKLTENHSFGQLQSGSSLAMALRSLRLQPLFKI